MSDRISQVIFDTAAQDLGVWEWAGAENNPKVLAYYADAGHPEVTTDATPWCAAFVGAVLAKVGVQGTGSLLARSYLDWGKEVPLSEARPGDVCIFKRGNSSWQGHVAFFESLQGGHIAALGGNQRDQVNISKYSKSKLLGIRRAVATGAVQSPGGSSSLLREVAGSGFQSKTNWAAGGLAGVAGSALTFLKDESDLIKIVAFILIAALAGYIIWSRNSKGGKARELLQ